MEGRIASLEENVSVMRKELSNLRRQVNSLKHMVRGEMQKIREVLKQQSSTTPGSKSQTITTTPCCKGMVCVSCLLNIQVLEHLVLVE